MITLVMWANEQAFFPLDLKFLPESEQEADFIYSFTVEMFGLLGGQSIWAPHLPTLRRIHVRLKQIRGTNYHIPQLTLLPKAVNYVCTRTKVKRALSKTMQIANSHMIYVLKALVIAYFVALQLKAI
jgi:hypothetical protein